MMRTMRTRITSRRRRLGRLRSVLLCFVLFIYVGYALYVRVLDIYDGEDALIIRECGNV